MTTRPRPTASQEVAVLALEQLPESTEGEAEEVYVLGVVSGSPKDFFDVPTKEYVFGFKKFIYPTSASLKGNERKRIPAGLPQIYLTENQAVFLQKLLAKRQEVLPRRYNPAWTGKEDSAEPRHLEREVVTVGEWVFLEKQADYNPMDMEKYSARRLPVEAKEASKTMIEDAEKGVYEIAGKKKK